MTSDTTISSGLGSGRLTLGGVKSKGRSESVSEVDKPVSVVPSDRVSLSSPAFLEKITKVQGFLEQLSYGETVISTALDNVETIVAKLEEVGGIAVQLEKLLGSSVSSDLLKPKVAQFDARLKALFTDIDNISKHTGFENENLLQGDVVSVSTDGGLSLSIEGYELDSEAFGFDQDSYESADGAKLLKGLVLQAIDQSVLFRSHLRAMSYEIDTRKDFSQNTIDVLLANAKDVAGEDAGQSDEALSLRSLQSHLSSQIHETGDSLALEAQYELLSQFR